MKITSIENHAGIVVANADIIDLSDENIVDYGFCLSTSNAAPPDGFAFYTQGENPTKGTYSDTLKGLIAGTRYFVYPYIEDESGCTYGELTEITAPSGSEILAITGNHEILSETSVKIFGQVQGIGSLCVQSFGLCLSDMNTVDSSNMVLVMTDPSLAVAFSSIVEGLTRGKTYYYRSFCKVVAGNILMGDVKSLQIPELQVVSNSFTATGGTSGTLSGEIIQLGFHSITDYGFVWSNTSANPTYTDHRISLGQTTTTGVFTSPLAGITPSVDHYFRAYAVSNSTIYYGDVISFRLN
ncbi:MAG: hypothetical protein KKD31_10725 [Bacteroidetes bacterium]|nr:hypothetical protein [Bacteroidota bacterium]